MYRTVKHQMLMSDSIENKTVYDLPGIGEVRGGRLESVGIRTASQLASLYKSLGRGEFESFLNRTCGQNSLWTGMTIMALDEYNAINISSVPQKSNANQNRIFDLPQVATASSKVHTKDDQLDKLSEQITSLRLSIQQFESKIESIRKENMFKYNQFDKLSDIVDSLQSQTEQFMRTNNVLSDKISSNRQKISELIKNSDKLLDISEKIEALGLQLRQLKGKFDEFFDSEYIFKQQKEQQQQFNKLSAANECLQKYSEVHTDKIKELNDKFALMHCQLATNRVDIQENIARKNDEFELLTEKLNNFESRIQEADKNNSKLNKKLVIVCGINAVLVIISTCLLAKQII